MNNEEIIAPAKLYHYTSKNGFLGIIENKTLWASGILYMNDEKETRIPFEILEELLKEDKNADIREKIDRIMEDRKVFLDLYEAFRGFEIYVISFSEKRDDLNLWRGYGDNASGICIEFNSKDLLNALKENQNQIELLSWEKCIYDKQEQKNKIQSLLDSVKEGNDFNDAKFFEEMCYLSTYFKDESFRDEHEWRITVKLGTELKNRKLKKIRAGKNIFVPYYELRIEKEKLPSEVEGKYPWLGDVMVGANAKDLFLESVLQACFVNGIGFCKKKVLYRDCIKSDIPYRGKL